MKFKIKYFNSYEEEECPSTLVHKFWVTELGKNDKANYFEILSELKKTLKPIKGFPEEIELHIRDLGKDRACLKEQVIAVNIDYIAGDYHNVWEIFHSVCHELGHLQQEKENTLIRKPDGLVWDNEFFDYYSLYQLEPEYYNYLPWEMDADKRASKIMKKLFPSQFKAMKEKIGQDLGS